MNIQSFCINLKQHEQKWINAKTALNKYNFDVERIDAVIGKDIIDIEEAGLSLYARYILNNPEQRTSHEQLNSYGGIGCILSHLKCWQKIVNRNLEKGAFIFEDDLYITDQFNIKFTKYMEELPNDIDVFSFGYMTTRSSCISPLLAEEGNFKSCNLFFGTQGYFVSLEGAKKLIKYTFPIEVQVDSYISLLGQEKKIKLLFSKESLIKQYNINGSAIQHDICWLCIMPRVFPIKTFMFCVILIIWLIYYRYLYY